MIYPEFLKKGDTIGICAPSSGVGHKLDDYNKSIEALHSFGFHTYETASVRNDNDRSTIAEERGKELNSLFSDSDIDFVMCAAGGDFLDECLPYVNFNLMKAHPKWLMGASDPTGILYPYTTLCDTATLYGLNAGSYSERPQPDFVMKNVEIIQGKVLKETSYKRFMSVPRFKADHIDYDSDSKMYGSVETLHKKGRCIGGCIDVLKDLIGTKFDGTKNFLQKYTPDGFIWYFDNFSLSAEVFYRTLLQMRYAGWFDSTKAVLMGRTLFPSSETGMSYDEALKLAFPDIPYIAEADIGHTLPHFTMINGACININYDTGQLEISFELI